MRKTAIEAQRLATASQNNSKCCVKLNFHLLNHHSSSKATGSEPKKSRALLNNEETNLKEH
jgi:hypothetical protein